MDIDIPGAANALHRLLELPHVQLLPRPLKALPLEVKPVLHVKALVLHQGACQLSGCALAGFFLDQVIFHLLEIPVSQMSGAPGHRGLGHTQPFRQLPDAHKEELICVVLHKIHDTPV